MVLITGSAGFVGSELSGRYFQAGSPFFGVDLVDSATVDLALDIGDLKGHDKLPDRVRIINLAAARFDYGCSPDHYYERNVEATRKFLEALDGVEVEYFLHVSSVAAFDGEVISYSNDLGCDDAYRVTKYLQERLVVEYCENKNIPLCILYPSAIWTDQARHDTNIGKLQHVVRRLPVLPHIPVKKTLTNLSQFVAFIDHCMRQDQEGRFLCVDNPIHTVSEIMTRFSSESVRFVRVPLLKPMLLALSYATEFLWLRLGQTPGLTPNRIVKLFSDTSYDDLPKGVDRSLFNTTWSNNSP